MFCAYPRARYQVSVYRTIGSLVTIKYQKDRIKQLKKRGDTISLIISHF